MTRILDNGYVKAVLVALTVAACGTAAGTVVTVAKLSERVTFLEQLPVKLDTLNTNVSALTTQVAVLNERLNTPETKNDRPRH